MARLIATLNEIERARRPERTFRDRMHPLDVFDDTQLYQRYRFTREIILELADLLDEPLCHAANRNCVLAPILQLFIALRYYATGTFQQVVGDIIQVDKATVSRVIASVSAALCAVAGDFIAFPDAADYPAIIQAFFLRAGFPGVIGAIDCTHVRIVAPSAAEKAAFTCRKGYPSINVQAVVDARGLFTDIDARWPGSTHDSRVFRNSALSGQLEGGAARDGHLVGDGGYACKQFLLTPFTNPQTAAQRAYNHAHSVTRVLVEQVFGRWKRRFHILHGEIRLPNPEKICFVIGACAVLQNVAASRNLPDFAGEADDADEDGHLGAQGVQEATGLAKRNRIVQTVFA